MPVKLSLSADGFWLDECIMAPREWVYVGARAGSKPPAAEKLAITAACERLIAEVLKPRYLPKIEPTEYNYPVAIYGKWHGSNYRFITRYHSDATQSEFEAPFARICFVARNRFDLSYHRHTGEWFCLYEAVTLDEALRLIGEGAHFQPC